MSQTILDSRQSEYRGTLNQLIPYLSGQSVQDLLTSINSDTTPPLQVTATNPASLVVDIVSSIISNPKSNRQRSLPIIDGVLPSFTSGTVTFPSSNGGSITTSTGQSAVLSLPSNYFVNVLLYMDASGNINILQGTPNTVAANANLPIVPNNVLPFAFVQLFNNSGTVNNVSQNTIFQFADDIPSGPGGGITQEVGVPSGATSLIVTLPTTLTGSYIVLAQFANYTDTNPQFQPIEIVNKTSTTFTLKWNAPTPNSNYFIDYLIPGNHNADPATAAKVAALSAAFVGTPAQVTSGVAQYSSLQAAHDAVSAGAKITLLSGFNTTENVTLSKEVLIFGSGLTSVLNGNITLASGSNGSVLKWFKVNGNIVINSSYNFFQEAWQSTSGTFSDTGTENSYQIRTL